MDQQILQSLRHSSFALFVTLTFSACCFASTTYQGSFSTGIDTITFTVVTDGTLGALTNSNLVSASFYDVGDLAFSSEDASVSLLYSKADLVATADGLFFNFDSTDKGAVEFQSADSSQTLFLSDTDTNIYCPSFSCFTLINTDGYSPTYPAENGVSIYQGGNQQIADFVAPEPGTWVMMTAGLGALAMIRRRVATGSKPQAYV